MRLDEAVSLARAIELDVVAAHSVTLARPRPATLLGRGKVAEIAIEIDAEEIELAVVDASLTPVQQRNLERAWNCKVVDRTGLILEIFGARARTKEGTLQVELAALSYQRSRLVRSWTHLERQRGGFGFTGGPGEAQIEIDRRLIDGRLAKIRRELDTVRRTRALHRDARRRVPYPVVALVGYTNAGKSTLFNRLTDARVLVKDQLFATLDPTMRAITLPSGRKVILSDTVGFISELPTALVAAFRATLEEVVEAELIVHVRDIAHPDHDAQKSDVEAVLGQLGRGANSIAANPSGADPGGLNPGDMNQGGTTIEVENKIDLLDPASRAEVCRRTAHRTDRAALSAATGEGCEGFLQLLDSRLSHGRRIVEFALAQGDGATIAWLYDHGEVLERRDEAGTAHLRVGLDAADLARFERRRRLATETE